MGLAGLALAWHRATPWLGGWATRVAQGIAVVATIACVVLLVATLLRGLRHPEAWAEDRRHPMRHTFIAALPIALLLLATVAVALRGPSLAASVVWGLASLSLLAVTLWTLSRWWQGPAVGGLPWGAVTPALFIPVVGNVVVPLAGVPLGQLEWSAAQFGVGLLFWPVVLVLLVVRLAVQGMWPARLLPASFILIAPPAVIGLSALQFGAPAPLVWMLWGMAMFCLAWVGVLARRILALPFAVPHWGLSFPLAALAALTLRLAAPNGLLAAPGSPLAGAGLALLALASVVIAALTVATIRGLRDGSLLVPEPAPVAAPG